jgi:ABC-type branched-subunit amino acid transport system substrate-binding protein
MRRSNLLRLLAIIFAISLIAAACGDDDDDTSSSGDDGSASSDDGSGDDGSGSGDDGSGDDGSGDDGSGDDGSGDDGSGDDGSGDDGEEPMDDATVPSNEDEGVTDDAIKVGWMGDITGPTASSQSFNNSGSDAYFTCLNERGGLFGRMIDYIPADDQFSAETAAVNWTKLIDDDKILTLVGLGGSHISTQLNPEIESIGLPVIGPPQTIDIQFTGNHVFNNLAHYGDQADIAAGQIAADLGGLENAVVAGISLEVPSGSEYAAYVEQSVTNGGGVYAGTLFLAPGATEVTAQMVQLQQWIDDLGVNYITLHGSPGSNLVVAQGLADVGLTELPVVGIHGVASNSLFTEGPADVVDQIFGAHSFLSANNPTSQSDEMARCAEASGHAGDELYLNFAHGWANGMIFEQAAIRAVEQTGELNRATLRDALQGTFDMQGITCDIDWTNGQHSPCGAAFNYDAAGGGLVPAAPFADYDASFDNEYGIDF